MPDKLLSRERYGEAFWRVHHDAWRYSELNQREYCEAQGIPLKAFGNRRAKFKAEGQRDVVRDFGHGPRSYAIVLSAGIVLNLPRA